MDTGEVSSSDPTGISFESDGDPWLIAGRDAPSGFGSTYVWHRDGVVWERWLITTSSGPGGIVLDSTDTPHIAFDGWGPNHDFKGQWYGTYTGSTWTFELVERWAVGGADILLDSTNTVHIVYEEGQSNLKHAEQTSNGWTVTNLATDYCCGLDAVIDAQDKIHVAYTDTRFNSKVVHGLFDPATSAWTTSTLHACEGSPSVDVDGSDVPHVACWERNTGLLHYTQDVGGGWVHEVVTDGGDLVPPRSPVNVAMETSTAVDGQDRVHIAFRNRVNVGFPENPLTPGHQAYAVQDSSGAWQVETVDRDGSWTGGMPDIVTDDQDRPWISYVYRLRNSMAPENPETPANPRYDLRLARPVIADAMDPVGTVT